MPRTTRVVASALLGKRPAPLDKRPAPLYIRGALWKTRCLRLSRPSAVYRLLQIALERAQIAQRTSYVFRSVGAMKLVQWLPHSSLWETEQGCEEEYSPGGCSRVSS